MISGHMLPIIIGNERGLQLFLSDNLESTVMTCKTRTNTIFTLHIKLVKNFHNNGTLTICTNVGRIVYLLHKHSE